MFGFLLRPRWIALTLLVLLAVPTCFALGQWQLRRYHARHAHNQLVAHNLAATPVPVEALSGAGHDVRPADRWRSVTVTGSYDPSHELLVRNRTQQGKPGFFVVTPIIKSDGAAVLVNRGWIGHGTGRSQAPTVPQPTAGQVTVTGRLRQAETRQNSGIRDRANAPPGQLYLINTRKIGATLPYPVYGAYVELVDQRPAEANDAPVPVPPPRDQDEGMNLSYFFQWNLFAATAVGTWLLLVWREARARRESRSGQGSRSAGGSERNSEGKHQAWVARSKTMH